MQYLDPYRVEGLWVWGVEDTP